MVLEAWGPGMHAKDVKGMVAGPIQERTRILASSKLASCKTQVLEDSVLGSESVGLGG